MKTRIVAALFASLILSACTSKGSQSVAISYRNDGKDGTVCYMPNDHSRDFTIARQFLLINTKDPKQNESYGSQLAAVHTNGWPSAREMKDLRWKVSTPVNAEGEAFWVAGIAFTPVAKYEFHGRGGRRIHLNPSFSVTPLTASQKQASLARAKENPRWTSEVVVSEKEVNNAIASLKTFFPESAAELDDTKNLQIEFVPGYCVENRLGEASWVFYNTKTNHELMLTNGNPTNFVDGFYSQVALTPW